MFLRTIATQSPYLTTKAANSTMSKKANTAAIGPQIGNSTSHQLQLIEFVNLSPMNKIPRAPKNPIPPEEFELDISIFL